MEKETLSLQPPAADTTSSGAAAAAKKDSASQEPQVPQTLKKPSHVVAASASHFSLLSEAESKPVCQDDVRSSSDVKSIPTASAEAVSTSVTQSRHNIAELREPRIIRCGSLKAVSKPAKMAVDSATRDAALSHYIKSLVSSSQDQLNSDQHHHRSDARGEFTTAGSVEKSSSDSAVKRSRLRIESSSSNGVMLRSLDSRETRVMTGLLSSLMPGSAGSRLASANCYKLVRKSNSSLRTNHRKLPATVSLKQLFQQLLPVFIEVNQCCCSLREYEVSQQIAATFQRGTYRLSRV